MKTKQDVQLALLLLLSPGGFSERLIAVLEIWLLLLFSTYFKKDNSVLYIQAAPPGPTGPYLRTEFICHFYYPSPASFFILIIVIGFR